MERTEEIEKLKEIIVHKDKIIKSQEKEIYNLKNDRKTIEENNLRFYGNNLKSPYDCIALLINISAPFYRISKVFRSFFNRNISNDTFDYTPHKKFEKGIVVKKDGNYMKKEIKKKEREEIDKEIIYLKEEKNSIILGDISDKKEYEEIKNKKRQYKKELVEKIKELENKRKHLNSIISRMPKTEWLKEHVRGRDFAAKEIIKSCISKDENVSGNEIENLFKEFGYTYRVEKHKNDHTILNHNLKPVQNENWTIEGYERICNENGFIIKLFN
ncbi:MAG: hypothetical protein ACOC1K_07300 [Nanoarchaeota archaeon]